MEIKNYKEGQQVITQGEDGGELFIVGSGKLSCSKKFPGNEEDTFLLEYSKGDVFGELALMYNAPRAASIKAKEESTLYGLDRDTFNAIVKRNAIVNREKYNNFLNKVEILTTLNQYEKDKVADCLL
jgi:cAMP-dependent protein kinase regulator